MIQSLPFEFQRCENSLKSCPKWTQAQTCTQK